MATIPDTLIIASAAEALGATAAAQRLRQLHALGATEEAVAESLRAANTALESEVTDLRSGRAALALEAESLRAVNAALEAQVRALSPTAGTVPVSEFRRRLIPLRVALSMHPDAQVRAKWAAVLPELDHFTIVYPTESPVADLIAMAVADGLLTSEGAALLAVTE